MSSAAGNLRPNRWLPTAPHRGHPWLGEGTSEHGDNDVSATYLTGAPEHTPEHAA